MKIGIVSTAVPHVNGGYRFIVDWLHAKLQEYGHQVETIYIPTTDEPDHIFTQMTALRMINFEDYYDRIITTRPQAHVIQHSRKVAWFIHHIRVYYDLWDTEYHPYDGSARVLAQRNALITADTNSLQDAHRLFTNSRVVRDRLMRYNALNAEVLYPPLFRPEDYYTKEYGQEIVCICRVEHHKRQHMLVEAMAHTKSPVRLRICGDSLNQNYLSTLRRRAERLGVEDRINFNFTWISETEKIDLLANALAAAYLPLDEDSYGYPTIEAAHANKCTVTLTDSGGVSEFVINGETGFIVEPEPELIAEAFDMLYDNKEVARKMGQSANSRVTELGINWDTVIGKLLS